MVLRCSLLGHDYGESEVEREREERGSEVVLTVEEYEECTRCGERNVISENTEVTTLTEPDYGADVDPDGAPDPTGGVAEPDPATDGADGSGPRDETGGETDGFADEEVPTTADGDPIVDDGEILEDEEEEEPVDREYGEWPESDDVGQPTGEARPAAWPDTDAEAADTGAGSDADVDADAASDADEYTFSETELDESGEPTGDDAVVIEDDPSTADVRGADEVATEADVASAVDDRSAPETGFQSAGSAPAPGESAPPEDVPTEFYCPRCSFVAPDDRGSLRPGDICPDCRKGYLGERER